MATNEPMIDAESLHHALASVARTLNTQVDWLGPSARDQIAMAITHCEKVLLAADSDVDDLAHACARALIALEKRERDRLALDNLRTRAEEKRAR